MKTNSTAKPSAFANDPVSRRRVALSWPELPPIDYKPVKGWEVVGNFDALPHHPYCGKCGKSIRHAVVLFNAAFPLDNGLLLAGEGCAAIMVGQG